MLLSEKFPVFVKRKETAGSALAARGPDAGGVAREQSRRVFEGDRAEVTQVQSGDVRFQAFRRHHHHSVDEAHLERGVFANQGVGTGEVIVSPPFDEQGPLGAKLGYYRECSLAW